MEYRELGNTGIRVSRLCFGSLSLIYNQGNLSLDEGSRLIEYAYSKGVNFIDTADLYDNYEYIRIASKHIGRNNLVIATKSYAYDKKTAEETLSKALRELDTDYIDIFLLHEQESIHTIMGHYEALEYFMDMKKKGVIRAIGISTHKIAGAKGFNQLDELDIIHPMINYKGIGLLDGTRDEMIKELEIAHSRNKGIYAMKVLAGGHLIGDVEKSVEYIRENPIFSSMAIGMQTREEVDCNLALVSGESYPNNLKDKLRTKPRYLFIEEYCRACESCVKACSFNAMEIVDGRAVANDKCVLCGYCASYCPDFCIKVI